MLKKITLAAFLSVASFSGFAASTIAIVDAQRVIQDSNKGKAFADEMEKFEDDKKAEIASQIATYKDKQKEAKTNLASMSEAKRREATEFLQKYERDIKRSQEDAQREFQTKLNKGLESFQKELVPLIHKIAKEKNIDAVFNSGAQSGLVFSSESVDITDLVIQRYNEMQ